MSIKTNRPEINFRDTDTINRLLKDVERSNGERNDSSKKLTIMGVGYIWGLESEFGGNFDNVTKFETDFKTEANKLPFLTRMYFKNSEIDCLKLIKETIKKCYMNNTPYSHSKQYVRMCTYLEFLENYNPSLRFENNTTTDKNTQTDINSSNETSQNGQNMNLILLDNLFIPEMTRGANPTKLERLKVDISANVCIYKSYQITALASFIYNNGTLHKNTRPHTFADWLKQLCEIIDYPQITTYKESSKLVIKELVALKQTYFYFIP